MAGTLSLRAHHLLCVFGFRGLGYGPAFVTNMRHTVERFFGDGAVEVVLVSGCDDVCAACPHALRGQCSAEQGGDGAVRTRDAEVLRRLGLSEGCRMDSSSLAQLVVDRIAPEQLSTICAGCPWLDAGYCQEGLRHRRA